jgi:1-pyrroline-5-carboxylate dehydrogenase
MANGIVRLPEPVNEPVRSYGPGSPEKLSLKKKLDEMLGEQIEIPVIIGGREIRTGKTTEAVCPHDHGHVLATVHQAGPREVEKAVVAAEKAWHEWSELDWEARAAVLLKAGELLAGPWRDTLNAATMLNQSKTVFQAEIDAAAEIVDFFRYNPYYMRQLYAQQPGSAPGIWDYAEYRALEGFVFAVTPFNFTSISANLPTAPALMGNTVLWKPASTSLYSNYFIMKLLEEAGMPPGVINFLPGKGASVGDPVMAQPGLAGIHFTGSTGTFQRLWKQVGDNIANYRTYPRIVGETGGKDFVFAHRSADVEGLVTALVRGAFEYQGQKCSAASRAYIPRSIWPEVQDRLVATMRTIKMGAPTDFRNFMCAVIDEGAFDNAMSYIDFAKGSNRFEIIAGGRANKKRGYYIHPTLVVSKDAKSKLMSEEIFAPILTVKVYPDSRFKDTLEQCDTTSPYALTGAIWGQDRRVIAQMAKALRHSAGNFYINDKPTGAVVGQQPFGGARASGTNDKAGSMVNLLRWTSQRSLKETFVPPTDIAYPHMGEE